MWSHNGSAGRTVLAGETEHLWAGNYHATVKPTNKDPQAKNDIRTMTVDQTSHLVDIVNLGRNNTFLKDHLCVHACFVGFTLSMYHACLWSNLVWSRLLLSTPFSLHLTDWFKTNCRNFVHHSITFIITKHAIPAPASWTKATDL